MRALLLRHNECMYSYKHTRANLLILARPNEVYLTIASEHTPYHVISMCSCSQ